jgi:DNA repair protein RecO (recombination protein O)
MNLIETEGIILKTYALGEADKIILLLTRQNGLRRLTVRGARKLKSRFSGSLEPYTIVNLIYQQKDDAELGKLFQTSVLNSNFHLAWQLEVQVALAYLSELLIAATPMHEPHETLYRMLRASIEAIDQSKNDLGAVKAIVFYFEIWLLRLSGFLPSFKMCAHCQKSFKKKAIYYQSVNSQFVCGDCASTSRWKEILVSPFINVLEKALTQSPVKFVEMAGQSDEARLNLQKITRSLLRKLIDYDPNYWTSEVFSSEEEQLQNLLSA